MGHKVDYDLREAGDANAEKGPEYSDGVLRLGARNVRISPSHHYDLGYPHVGSM